MNGASKHRRLALADAQRALQRGDWRSAAQELERAAELARIEGDAARATHCLQMASALQRARGEGARAIASAGGPASWPAMTSVRVLRQAPSWARR